MAIPTRLMRAVLVLLALVVCWTSITTVDAAKKKKNAGAVLTGDEKSAALTNGLKEHVFEFTTETYQQLALRPDRPYHLVVLFTAIADKYACEACKTVHPEFYTLAESYAAAKQIKVDTRDGLEVYFGVVDFDSNQQVFGLYGFTSAPHIGYLAPDSDSDEGKRLPTKSEIPAHNMYNIYQQGKKAEDMVDFIKQKTGFDFVIQRSKAVLYAVLVTVLASLVIIAKVVLSNLDKVIAKLRRKRLWMTVSLLFYGLSVSGMVFCIIREPPAYQTERNGNIKFFHPAGRSQFVVEGLIVGGLDVAAAGFVILLSQWAIYLEKPVLRYVAVLVCLLGFAFMYQQMIGAYKFKNRWYQGWLGF